MMQPTEQNPLGQDEFQAARHDAHYAPLQNAIPHWIGKAAPHRRQALRRSQPKLPDKLNALPAAQHQKMQALNGQHWTAQNEVDQLLEKLQDAAGFAEPLLVEALQKKFGIANLDVRKTWLRFYIPIAQGAARTWTVSLLDAALHNFEDSETRDDAYEEASTFITEPDQSGRFQALPLLEQTIGIPAFTRLCRELDLGRQYQQHLREVFGLDNPRVARALRSKVDESQKAALRAALQFARMSKVIQEGYAITIEGVLDGLDGLRLNHQPFHSHDLSILATPLTGITIFALDLEQARDAVRIVAYIPDDPEHPIKEYASSSEFATDLTRKLRSPDYQHFFSRFVAHEHRGHFFSDLNRRLSEVKFHPPVPGSGLPSWRETPIDNPDLHLRPTIVSGDLWQHLYQNKLDKILNDGQAIAIPTAMVDQKVRWAFWDSVISIGKTILNVAAFVAMPFVPFLGEAMLAYMAWQMLNDTFEGILEWAQGRTAEAFDHLMGVTESLIELGLFAVGGSVIASEFRQILPQQIVQFIDRFEPVAGPNGKTLYWKPDLTPYKQKLALAQTSRPNALGLHLHEGNQVLPMEGEHFVVSKDPLTDTHRIEHPTRPDAYNPPLRGNGDGAWHTTLEQPLTWDKDTLLSRIGHSVDSFTPVQREQILEISGHPEDALRKMHVDQEPTPPLLADTIKRFKIDQDLQRLTEQLASDVPEQYRGADPIAQLEALSEGGLWPSGKQVRLLDDQGQIAWESAKGENLSLIELRQNELTDGDMLKTLLQNLDEHEIDQLLKSEFGDPFKSLDTRTGDLRKKLAQIVKQNRRSLFESRYTALEHSDSTYVQNVVKADPQLPVSVARELVDNATGEELLQIHQGQLPERLEKLAGHAKQEVRVTRAYEGLALESVDPVETAVLMLHSLEKLPSWPADVRLDVRSFSFNGELLDSIGSEHAPVHRVLVRQADGRYEAYDSAGQNLHGLSDFYDSVLRALPDAQRDALKMNIGEGRKLQKAVEVNPLERGELRTVLNVQPVEPVVDTLRLLGNVGYEQVSDGLLSLRNRVRELYPAVREGDIPALIRSFGSNPRATLSRLHQEHLQLQHELQIWANNPPAVHPTTGRALNVQQLDMEIRNRRFFRREIMRGWRRESAFYNDEVGPESGHVINFSQPILGDLPVLSGDFSHISVLALDGSTGTRGINAFLERFSGLRKLKLTDFHLNTVPEAIGEMRGLTSLSLTENELVLTPAGQSTLSSLRALRSLDLSDNPQLTLAPNIENLPELSNLDLSGTRINHLPAGMQQQRSLITGFFDNNNLTELPEWAFELSAEEAEGFTFGNNPLLSATTREKIKAFYQRTAQCFDVRAEPADIHQTQDLYPNLDDEEASDFFYMLRGTQAEGRLDLARRRAELDQLLVDLTAWTDNAPANHPVTGAALTEPELTAEKFRREAFMRNLENCWRQIPKPNAPEGEYGFASHTTILGELPVLNADFSHVPVLQLSSPQDCVTTVGQFLESFPNLEELSIRAYQLGDLPPAIFNMDRLTVLNLPECAITLTEASADALADMEELDVLNLRDNPLGRTPDLRGMMEVSIINLSGTGISEVPPGLLGMDSWADIDLSRNQISEMPAELIGVDPAHTMNFRGNPFTQESLQRIARYYRRTGNDLNLQGLGDIVLPDEEVS
jgi:Leucine-rich repeat (LRR) protein